MSGKSEYNFFFKMKVYNKTVIDRLLGHQQFCLTLEWICCGNPQAEGNRSVLRSNKLLYAINKSIDYSIEHWLICIMCCHMTIPMNNVENIAARFSNLFEIIKGKQKYRVMLK